MKSTLKLVMLFQLIILHGLSFGQTNIFPSSGNVGIGTITPVDMLQVTGGDIHITNANRAYRLGSNNILWHNGLRKGIFVGEGTGNSTVTGDGNTLLGAGVGPALTSGVYNTATGYASGNLTTTGGYNSFFGESSGRLNTTGSNNVLFGRSAGYSNVTGSGVTALGSYAGFSNTVSNNSFVGFEAGFSNTTGIQNTFIGHKAGRGIVTGQDNTATGFEAGLGVATNNYNYNCFYGSQSGRANSTGDLNTFVGYNTGPANTTAEFNVFIGAGAGSSNTDGGYNTFIGYLSGMSNANVGAAKGINNTFIGYHSGRYNVIGQGNTAVGMQAGRNTTSGQNVYLGQNAGYANTSGGSNTAIGYQAGNTYTTGSNSSYLGYNADANGNYTNAAAIGSNSVTTASDKMYFGNAAVIGCYNTFGLWTSSDGRFKFNVNENVSGLDFINRLRPVTYQMNTAELDAFVRANMPQDEDSTGAGQSESGLDFGPSMARIHAGFIAQEVEQAAIESGFASSIVSSPSNENDPYAISYSQIVVPLVKAVQEQQVTIENQNERMGQLEEALARMQGLLEQCCTTGASMRLDGTEQGQASTALVELGSIDGAILYQNRPNPFTDGTVINYYLPKSVKVASMVFHDNAGQAIKEIVLTDRGSASVTIQPTGLAAGVYTYSLTVDGKTVETRRMVKGN